MKIRKGGTRPGVWCHWCEPRRAERGGQSCAYEAQGMAHGDVDMSDVHGDSAATTSRGRPRCSVAQCSPSQGYMFTIHNQHETPRATAAARPIPTG